MEERRRIGHRQRRTVGGYRMEQLQLQTLGGQIATAMLETDRRLSALSCCGRGK
jgi:hypothetical protein